MFLNPEDLAIVRDILAKHLPEYEVRTFGSRVTGKHLKKFSDLDLVVMTDKPLDSRLGDLKEAFSESDLPFRVDVLDWASTSGEFRKRIEEAYEIL